MSSSTPSSQAFAYLLMVTVATSSGCGGPSDNYDAGDPAIASDGGDDDVDDGVDESCPEPCAGGLHPLAEGLRWNYALVAGVDGACGDAYSQELGTHAADEAGTIVPLLSDCPESGNNISWLYGDDGQVYSRWQQGEWRLLLQLPPEQGATWEVPFVTYRWESSPDVDTAAGSFTGCWRHLANDDAVVSTYCAHVGVVKVERSDGSVYELSSKSF